MTVITPPLFQSVSGTYTGASLGVPYRDILSEGVVGLTDLKVSQRGAGANMSVDVAAGVAWVLGDSAVTQPLYRCYNDGTVNLAVAAADATNPRIDRVVAEVLDSAYSGVSQLWRLRVITGTPAGSPSAPALPSTAISLATISVLAASTTVTDARITDARTFAVAGVGSAKTPSCRAQRTSTQSIANTTWTSASLTAEDHDTHNMHDNATNPSRITIPVSGVYAIEGHVYFGASVTGARQARLIVNGATTIDYWTGPMTSAGDVSAKLVAKVKLNAGDYVEMQAWQNTGGALNIGSSSAEFLHLDVCMVSGG